MRKLLSANFYRLWRSKVFWTLEGICFAIGVFAYALVAYNTHNIGQGWLEYNAHVYFYLQVIYIAFVIVIFSCFFIGTEYSDGTIRNKLIVGCSRKMIYLCLLLTTLTAAVFFLLAWLLAVLLVGLPFSGIAVLTHVQAQPWRIINSMLVIAEYAALFTLFSMLDSYKARSLVICMLSAAAVLAAGMMVYGRLTEPEFIVRAVMQPGGGFQLQDGVPNSRYLIGTIRTVFEWITMILPSGSVMLSLDKNLSFDWRNPLCAIVGIALLTALGIRFFRRKDIR